MTAFNIHLWRYEFYNFMFLVLYKIIMKLAAVQQDNSVMKFLVAVRYLVLKLIDDCCDQGEHF
jgi:hypothetical protein